MLFTLRSLKPKYNPRQPRAPKGKGNGGEWVDTGGSETSQKPSGGKPQPLDTRKPSEKNPPPVASKKPIPDGARVQRVKELRNSPNVEASESKLRTKPAADTKQLMESVVRAMYLPDGGGLEAVNKLLKDAGLEPVDSLEEAQALTDVMEEVAKDVASGKPQGSGGGGKGAGDKGEKSKASLGESLANAAHHSAGTASATKKFTSDSDDPHADQIAREQFDSALDSLSKYYEAQGFAVTRTGSPHDSNFAIVFEKDGRKVTVRGSTTQVANKHNGKVRTTHSLSVFESANSQSATNDAPAHPAADTVEEAHRHGIEFTPRDASWDESKHPRVPGGDKDGGQFADGDKSASDWSREMAALRDTKPRPIDKLYGKNGPTPEQKVKWDDEMRAWNAKHRKASMEQKKALKREQDAAGEVSTSVYDDEFSKDASFTLPNGGGKMVIRLKMHEEDVEDDEIVPPDKSFAAIHNVEVANKGRGDGFQLYKAALNYVRSKGMSGLASHRLMREPDADQFWESMKKHGATITRRGDWEMLTDLGPKSRSAENSSMSYPLFSREQVSSLMERIAEGLPQLLGLSWDESKHPRAPAGDKDGGQWTSNNTGGRVQSSVGKRGTKYDLHHNPNSDFAKKSGYAYTVVTHPHDQTKSLGMGSSSYKTEAEARTEIDKNEASIDKYEAKVTEAAAGTKLPIKLWDHIYTGNSMGGDPDGNDPPYWMKVKSLSGKESTIKLEKDPRGKNGPKKWALDILKEVGSLGRVSFGERIGSDNYENRGSVHLLGGNKFEDYVGFDRGNIRGASDAGPNVDRRAAEDNDVDNDDIRYCGDATGPIRALAATTGKVRRELLFGEPHLVVPVRALRQGVIYAHGATSPEYVPAESFARLAMAWNMRPVMAGHPQVDGRMVSAASPAILDKYCIGWTFASQYAAADNALDMEAWINERQAKLLGGDAAIIAQRAAAGDCLEVSVGAHVTVDSSASGDYLGKKYRGAWRETGPDHLAFLRAGERGACSIEMGCGANRAAGDADPDSQPSHRHACSETCSCKKGGAPADDNNPRKEDTVMIEETRINALIAKGLAIPAQLPFLKTLSDSQFAALEAATPVKVEVLDRAAIEKQVRDEIAASAPKDAAAYIAAAPAEIRDLLDNGLRSAEAHKSSLVARLVALKERCPYDEPALKAMTTKQLEGLVRLAGAEPVEQPDFSGRGGPRALGQNTDSDNKVYTQPPDPWAAGIAARQAAQGIKVEKAS